MGETAIEWTDVTWNPVTGCDRVSPGCAHCYALDLAARLKSMGQPRYQRDGDPRTSGPGFGVTLHPDKLEEPLRWRKPRMVFVNSMSDLFHEEIPDEFIGRVFAAMAVSHQHTFQVLTKRPERMLELLSHPDWLDDVRFEIAQYEEEGWEGSSFPQPAYPFTNVWLGVSIENRRFVHRADVLRETPAAVRFVSAEPLLGPLVWDASAPFGGRAWSDGAGLPPLSLWDIDWLIVGGESGPRARPMKARWVRDLRDACLYSPYQDQPRTAFFMKQMGGRRPGDRFEDLPEEFRIREMPEVLSVAAG